MGGRRLVSRTAQPYLAAVPAQLGALPQRELLTLRQEALAVLGTAYRSGGRLALGLLAAVAGLAGGGLLALALTNLDTWPVAGTIAAAAGGLLAVAAGLVLGSWVVSAGRAITTAAGQWLRVPAPAPRDGESGDLQRTVLRRAVLGGGLALLGVAAGAAALVLLAQRGLSTTPAGDAPAWLPDGAVGVPAAVALALGVAVTTGTGLVMLRGAGRLVDAAWRRVTVAPAHAPAPPHDYWAPAGDSPRLSAVPPVAAAPAPAPAPPVPSPALPAPAVLPPPSGLPVDPPDPPTVEIDLAELAAALREQGAQRSAPTAAVPDGPGTGLEVVLPGGGVIRTGTTLVGRQPVRRPDDVDPAELVVLSDRTVTKTHAAIVLDDDGLRVVDRASTNGTLLEDAAGTLVRCRPWQETPVRGPGTLHLGRARLQIRSEVAAAGSPGPLEVAS